MAENTLKTRYEIELDIKNGDKVNSRISDIDRSLADVSKSAKSLDFKGALDGVKGLEKSMADLAKSGDDCTKEWAEFERASIKAYKDLEAAAVKLNYSLSEQGQQQRARIKELEAEKSALDKSVEGKKRAREIEKELKELRKQVVDLSDDEIKEQRKANTQARARIKILQQEAKLQKQETKEQKTLGQLIKADLKPLRDKIKSMKDFAASLKTVEGRYKAVKAVAKGAFAVGKMAAKGALAVGGGVLAIGGAAIASADKFAQREHEADRIKGTGSRDEKVGLLTELYTRTGADDTSIVDAINRVYAILGNVPREQLVEAATAEVKMPGLAAIFRQQNSGPVSAQDFTAYFNRMRAQQSMTGASIEQITSSSGYLANLKQSSFSNATVADLQGLYLALQNSGAFDTEDELKKAFEAFVRTQSKSNVDVFDLAKQWQESGKWLATAQGATNRTQAENVLKNLDFKGLGRSSRMTDRTQAGESASEYTARRMRELEIKKDQFLLKILEAIQPIIDAIDVNKLTEFFNGIIKIVADLAPYVGRFISFVLDAIGPIVNAIAAIIEWIQKGVVDRLAEKGRAIGDWVYQKTHPEEQPRTFSGQSRANGGVASVPSIFGEGNAPEIAIPFDPARAGRAQQLVGYVNNIFNMSGNETTSMSLASALNSRDFVFQSGRMDRLNRRMGR